MSQLAWSQGLCSYGTPTDASRPTPSTFTPCKICWDLVAKRVGLGILDDGRGLFKRPLPLLGDLPDASRELLKPRVPQVPHPHASTGCA